MLALRSRFNCIDRAAQTIVAPGRKIVFTATQTEPKKDGFRTVSTVWKRSIAFEIVDLAPS
jgi:hypothetical protein